MIAAVELPASAFVESSSESEQSNDERDEMYRDLIASSTHNRAWLDDNDDDDGDVERLFFAPVSFINNY